MSAEFHREACRRIAETFPHSRLPFFQSLRLQEASSAFRRIAAILRDEEKAWRLFILALHVLYEARHDLPPFTAAERKTLCRCARTVRDVAGRLRKRKAKGAGNEPGALDKIADRLECITQPSIDAIYGLRSSRGNRFDPGEAIAVMELANLFRRRLPATGFFPIIADFMNTLPGRHARRNVKTIKNTLARVEATRFQPRIQFTYPSPGLVSLKFRNSAVGARVRVIG